MRWCHQTDEVQKFNPEYTKIEGQMDALDSLARKKVNYLQRETS